MIDRGILENLHHDTPAADLVAEFLKETRCKDESEAKNTQSVVLMTADYLSLTTGPLTWGQFQVKDFFARIASMDEEQRICIGLVLMGFYGWLIFAGIVSAGDGLGVIQNVRDAAPRSELLRMLCERSLEIIPPVMPN